MLNYLPLCISSLKSKASGVSPGIMHISEKEGSERAKELSGNVLSGHFRGTGAGHIPASAHPWPSARGEWAIISVDDNQGPHKPVSTLQCDVISLNDPPTDLH